MPSRGGPGGRGAPVGRNPAASRGRPVPDRRVATPSSPPANAASAPCWRCASPFPSQGADFLREAGGEAPLAAAASAAADFLRAHPKDAGRAPAARKRRPRRADHRTGDDGPRGARLGGVDGAELPATRAAPTRGRDRSGGRSAATTSGAPASAASGPPWSNGSPTRNRSGADPVNCAGRPTGPSPFRGSSIGRAFDC